MVKLFPYVLKRFLCFVALNLFLIFVIPVIYAQDSKPVVLVTTSAIESIVREIAPEEISVICLIPPDSCPGHFDLRPSDAYMINSAKIILGHKFEKDAFLRKISGLAKETDAKQIVAIETEGSWMVPDVYIRAVDEISVILKKTFPSQAQEFDSKALDYTQKIEGESVMLKARARELGIATVSVVTSKMQEDLLFWLGAKVVANYGRPEEMSALELQRVIDRARNNRARVVIDNLQSSGKAGKAIAEELGIAYLTFSNFPKVYEGKISYLDTLKDNIQQLFNAMEKWGQKTENQ